MKLALGFRFGNLTPNDLDQWENLSLAGQGATPFHSFEWEQVLRLSFPDETSVYWGIWRNDELIAIWPSSLVPLLGGTMLNPLFLHAHYFATAPAIKNGLEKTISRDLMSDITEVAKQRYRAWSWYLSIPRNWAFAETARHYGFEVRPTNKQPSILLHTAVNPEVTWKNYPHGGLRTCVRKAERVGLEVRESSDQRDLNEYFLVKYPEASHPKAGHRSELSFWEAIRQLFVCRGKAKLFVTCHEGRIIGGAIVFFQNNKAYLWNMGSMQSTWRMHPNHILLWTMIRWAYTSGIECIDCGNGTKGTQYFVGRNLANFELINHVALTFPINRLGTLQLRLHALTPSSWISWYCRKFSGILSN